MADPTVTPIFNVPTGAAPKPAERQLKYEEQDGKHKGVAGVARDILGTLGDFLLTRLRMPAMYAPAQRQRKEAAAMEGYNLDPEAAISRLESINAEAGRKAREQYIDNQRLAASQAATIEEKEGRLSIAQQLADTRTRGYAASMLGSMATWDDKKREEFYPKMREQVLNAAKRQNLDLSAELPEKFDSVTLDAFIDASVPVGTQRSQRLTRERMEQQAEQAQERIETTKRGQDIRSADTRRGQDIRDNRAANGQAIRASGGGGGGRGGKVTNVQTYVGEDGYKYTYRSDGTSIRSTQRVRTSGSKPVEGQRRFVNGRWYTWKGGKAVAD